MQNVKIKHLGLILGLISFAILQLLPPPLTIDAYGWGVLSVMLIMMIWWITEAVPLPITGLLPIALFPLIKLSPLDKVTPSYADPLIYLFLGGFFLAAALERWKLHKRIALTIVCWVGSSGARIIGGFMVSTAFLSMWISNTATTVMMLPMALSVIQLFLEDTRIGGSEEDKKRFTTALLLSIPYAATIGGMATLIGTPPNAILAGFLQKEYGITVDFVRWMMVGFPIALSILVISWWLLARVLFRYTLPYSKAVAELIHEEKKALGKTSLQEKMVIGIFSITAFLWIFRPLLNELFDDTLQLSDPGIAIFMAIFLFMIPSDKQGEHHLLDWQYARHVDWGILLLFGGGLALASALSETRFVSDLAGVLPNISSDYALLLFCAVAMMLFMTEFMSNMALTALFLPVVASVAETAGISPVLLAIPVTFAASCAFMLPIGTPPNSIVFASGHIRISQMMYAGFFLNIVAVIIITLLCYWLVGPVFGV